jgi:glycerophosphoryl diester phosphodiesterase
VKRIEIIGHRGDGAGPDENTLASCRRAIRKGADAVELDVQLVDGELRLGHPPQRPKARLADVLPGLRCEVILHLKRRGFNPWHDRAAADLLAPVVTRRPMTSVSSVWPGTLTYLKRSHPKVRTILNTWAPTYDLLFSKRLGATEYCCWHRTVTGRTIRRAGKRGIKLSAFVVSPESAERLSAWGVRRLMTDRVESLSALPVRRR